MRRVIVGAIVAGLLAVPLGAGAHHRPITVCSQTGDICQSTARVDGVRSLRVTLFARFFTRFRLCVKGPSSTTCKDFRVHETPGGLFASRVNWANHFPDEGSGAYTVKWLSLPGAVRVGSVLGFHEH